MNDQRIFIDTNVFLRYLTNDLPIQADAFEKWLLCAARGDCVLITSTLVIAEMVWTLESFYKLSKENIQIKILAILNTPGLEITEDDTLLQAMIWYVDKNVDFIDAYNAAWMVKQGIKTACTFDAKHFSRFEDLEVKQP